ncbi:VAMP-associated protein [Saccharata proteae CBS 121410]|uniref:VAMP-associated protein n=1 Tax=Saccharata proteae CBS 121410 TaxID=1314787 RepID=A0A9P4HV66_9PEZI|nr:VAMP-associated protein [Saccharata proteae CBS 121410]
MSVELQPPELGFKRPFTSEVSQTLRLRNPHSDPVAFKVKTTAPKQYCVRPNSGRIEPGQDVEVQVLLQAMKEDPPPDARCRDKFLVQSVAVTADKEFTNVASIWNHIEQTAKQSIQEKKIRVVFLPADGSANTPSSRSINGTSMHDSSMSQRSPSPEAVTPQRMSTAAPVGAISRPESRPSDSRHLGDAVNSASNPATSGQSTFGSAIASVASVVPTSAEDVRAQLAEAKAQIARLQGQVESQGLRQRKSDAVNRDAQEKITTGTTGLGTQQTPASGVPVQIVAGLCLLSFLLAYFFF